MGFLQGMLLRKPGYVNLNQVAQIPLPADGGTTANIQLKLTPAGTIVGHVTPESGELPNSLRVVLQRRQAIDGAAQWVQAGGAALDRDGDFRFAELSPGDYMVETRAWTPLRGRAQALPNTVQGLLPTYYPDAKTLAEATPIHLHAGETVTANLRPASATLYRVSVGVEGVDGAGFGATLVSDEGYSLGSNGMARTLEGYLPTGSYLVRIQSARQPQGDQPVDGRRARRPRDTWFAHLQVASAPLVGTSVTAAPAPDLQIVVTKDFTDQQQQTMMPVQGGGQPRTPPPVYVDLQPVDAAGSYGFGEPEVEGDTVTLRGANEGTFHVHINPARGYVASAMSGSTNLLTSPLTIGSGGSTAPIYVTLRDDFATLSCRIRQTQGAAPEPQMVFAMAVRLDAPETRPVMLPLFSPAISTDTMRPTPAKVAPGRYLVLATRQAGVMGVEYRSPDVLPELMSKGVVVTVGPGENADVEVPVMTDGGE